MVLTLDADRPPPEAYADPVDPRSVVLTAVDGHGSAAGVVQWQREAGVATVGAIWSASGPAGDVAVLEALRRHAAGAGVTSLVVEVGADQASLLEALQHAPVLSTFMVKPTPATAPPSPTGFAVREMTADEYAVWLRRHVEEYAESDLARCGGDRELAERRSHESFARFLPDGAATADTRLLTLTRHGEPVGDLWVRHHWPRYRDPAPGDDQTFVFDVRVAEGRRGEGLGRAAMLAVESTAIEVGDRQLGLNVFGDNHTAAGLYRSLGYRSRSTVYDVALLP